LNKEAHSGKQHLQPKQEDIYDTLQKRNSNRPMARSTLSKPVKIPFRMHPRVFSSLGADLVTNDIVAIIELVKNAYDAFATRVDVRFRQPDGPDSMLIEIEDNGEGMSRSVIENVWCVVATPYRMAEPVTKRGKKTRRVSGEKGLGRLSAARLGNRLEMITKSADGPCWQVNVDWLDLATQNNPESCSAEIFEYTAQPPFGDHGTIVRVHNLNDPWNQARWNELKEQLSRLVSPFAEVRDFEIWLTLPDEEAEPTEIEPPDFLSYPPYSIKGKIDGTGFAHCEYTYSAHRGAKKRTIKKSLWADTESAEDGNAEVKGKGSPACGPFDFEIRAWDIDRDSLEEIAERFENLNRQTIRKDIKNYRGISVYRDGILVSPKSESARDWLGLDIRRVSRLGRRLSTSQVVGYATITANSNPKLKDTSDRERLVDSTATSDFIKLLTGVVEILEGEREKDRQEATHKEPPFKDLFAALSAEDLVDEVSRLAKEGGNASDVVPLVEEFNTRLQETIGQIERRLIYYSRLASIGVLSAIIVHEVRNQTLVIGRLCRMLRKLFDQDDSSVKKIESDLNLAEQAVRSLERIADRFAPLASRAFGTRRRDCILEDTIRECLAMREQEIKMKKIIAGCISSTRTTVAVDPGELIAVLINLLDNALYWFSYIKDRERRIEFRVSHLSHAKRAKVEVHDSGPGIQDGDEERIFWPGVTRKPEGLGMGLTVASEIVAQYGGKMYLIKPGVLGGASFGFDLPICTRAK
jgi:signal transduction histidine kinase